MIKKIWFYLCLIQFAIIAGIFGILLWSSLSTPNLKRADLKEYIEQFSPDNNYIPDTGYVPDARTAKIIGSQIIDNFTGNSRFCPSSVTVKYDEENRLWLVEKGYFYSHGGFIIIEQDSGKIIKALLTK